MRVFPSRLNRTWLGIIGAVLLLAGLAAILVGSGAFRDLSSRLSPKSTPFQGATRLLEQPWVPAAGMLLAAVVILLSLWWLVRQIPRSRRASALRFHADARSGVTTMESSVFTDAVAGQAEELEDVVSARAVLRGSRADPELILRIDVTERASARAAAQEVLDRVVPSAAYALGSSFSRVGVHVAVTRQAKEKGRIAVR